MSASLYSHELIDLVDCFECLLGDLVLAGMPPRVQAACAMCMSVLTLLSDQFELQPENGLAAAG